MRARPLDGTQAWLMEFVPGVVELEMEGFFNAVDVVIGKAAD